MTTSNRPTNGWDALIKIVEMIIESLFVVFLFLTMTPYGWMILFGAFLIFTPHHPLPPGK